MEVKALIIEQIEADGTIKTLQLSPKYNQPLVVAFAEEYEETRSGPFHFLNEKYEAIYKENLALIKKRKLGKNAFIKNENEFTYKTFWKGLPTLNGPLTYYSLLLPEFAIPNKIQIFDPHSNREYKKYVYRDDKKNRFVIYLECRSRYGVFDFSLEANFSISEELFQNYEYNDNKLIDLYGREPDMYQYPYSRDINENQILQINQFFEGGINMGDTYNANQVGAMGKYATASNIQFTSNDLEQLKKELAELKNKLKEQSSSDDLDIEISNIILAEKAAKEGNQHKVLEYLKNSSKYTLDVAKDIGVNLVSELIKTTAM